MFVTRSRLKAQGALASVALLALGACEDPTASTDLRPEGAPEVLTVLVMNDPGGFLETATFCKVNDEKRPGFVGVPVAQICDEDLANPAGFRETDPDTMVETFVPATVSDAVPTGFYVRFMFDELLDPDVEELIPITEDADGDPATPETATGTFTGSLLNTQPVIFSCTAPGSTTATQIAYDGYYSPSGNNVTWPLGPSLVVFPVDPSTVATGSTCTVEIKDTVVDKNAEPTPAEQRGTDGTYKWDVAALAFAGSAPAPAAAGEEEIITPDSPLILSFNAFIDAASLAATEIEIREGADCTAAATGTVKTAVISADPADPLSINVGIAGVLATCTGCVWNPEKAYLVTFSADNAVTDLAGGPGAIASDPICFVTDVAP